MNLMAECVRGGAVRLLARGVLLLLLASLWLGAPNAFGQGKSGPQKTFASPEAAAKALGAAYQYKYYLWAQTFTILYRERIR